MSVPAASRQAKLAASAALARKNRFNDAEMVLSDLAAELPGDIEVLAAMGALALGRGDATRAKTIFGEILRVAPDRADVLASLAQAHRLEDDIAAAATCLRRAVDLNGSAQHRAALAEILLLQDEPLRANAEIGLALRDRPDDFAIRMVAGLAAIALGDIEAAGGHFSRAHRISPEEPEPLNNLAELATRQGHAATALAHAEAAYLLDPAEPALVASYAGKLLATGATAKADGVIQRGLATQPSHPVLLRLKAEMRLAAGDAQAAIAEFAAFVGKNRRPETVRALAGLLRQAGRLDQALALLMETLKTDAKEPAIAAEALDLALCTADFATAQTLGFTAEASIGAVHVNADVMAAHLPGEILLLAQMLPSLGGDNPITLHADHDLATLAALVPGIRVRPLSEAPGGSVPLPVVLPIAIGASPDPAQLPVTLAVDPSRAAVWQQALSDHARPAIGLLWAEDVPGLTLPELAGALAGLGTLVSLAVGHDRNALAGFPDILDAGAHIDGPDDLAAAISELDLVVSVDALAANLAGGLSRPGVVLVAPTGTWFWASRNGRACWAPTLSVIPFGPGQPVAASLAALRDTARQHLAALPALHPSGE